MKTDRREIVTIRGRHRYATDPADAEREMIVGFRALEVEILDTRGSHIAAHPRAYGDAPTSSENPSRQLDLLGNRPGAWPNSQVRQALPEPLREWLDWQEKGVLRGNLRTLKHADRGRGWQHVVTAMLQILETTGTTNRASVELAAARLAAGTRAVDYDEPVNLTEYDQAFTTKEQA